MVSRRRATTIARAVQKAFIARTGRGSRGSFVPCTTSTSSTWSKRADGSTRISLNSPAPRLTERTRPPPGPSGRCGRGRRSRPRPPRPRPSVSGTYFMTRSVATAPSTPTWPETIPVTRLRSIMHPRPALAVQEELNLGRVGAALDHAPEHPGGAEHRGLQLHAVLAALVDGERAVPGKAVAAHHLRGQRLQGQDRPQARGARAGAPTPAPGAAAPGAGSRGIARAPRAAGSPRARRAGPRIRSTPPAPRAPPRPPRSAAGRGARRPHAAGGRRRRPRPPGC